jgi:hypothetical protein
VADVGAGADPREYLRRPGAGTISVVGDGPGLSVVDEVVVAVVGLEDSCRLTPETSERVAKGA